MPKRMKSPDGGFTHAYTEAEEKYLISLGWVVEQQDEKPRQKLRLPSKVKNGTDDLH